MAEIDGVIKDSQVFDRVEYNGLEIDSPRKQDRPNYQVEDFLTYYSHSAQEISPS